MTSPRVWPSFRPLANLPHPVPRAVWRADAVAGLTVAVFAVPQAMAYAVLAGLPPVHGLYAAIAMSIVAALWGSSPFVNSGPTNTAALLTAATLAPLLNGGASLLALVGTFTLLVGLIRLLMGLLRLGWLVRFVPEPAFLGFVTAADILIALGQLHQFFGVETPQSHSTLARLGEVLVQLPQSDVWALFLGGGVVAMLAIFDRFSKKIPVALGAILLATLAAQLLTAQSGHTVALVRDIAPIPRGWAPPQFVMPDFAALGTMLPGALAVAVIGLIEAISIGQTMALKKRSEVDFNQEFFGQGLGQIAGALAGGMPGSGSFSRSALVERCGGQTALANVFFGVFTALALLLTPRLLESIPLAALAGLLFFTGFKLLDIVALRRVYHTSRADFGVLILTFGVTFFGKIEWGFFAGVVAAMAVFLNRARALQLLELVPKIEGQAQNGRVIWEEIAYHTAIPHQKSAVVALSVHGDLFFGLAHELRAQLGRIQREQNPQFVVLRLRRASSIDYSCWKAIFDFAEAFRERGGTLLLSGIRPDLGCVIEQAGMSEVLPPETLFAPAVSSGAAFESALRRVGELLQGDAPLSASWGAYFDREKRVPVPSVDERSFSNWRDPFNDPATLGLSD